MESYVKVGVLSAGVLVILEGSCCHERSTPVDLASLDVLPQKGLLERRAEDYWRNCDFQRLRLSALGRAAASTDEEDRRLILVTGDPLVVLNADTQELMIFDHKDQAKKDYVIYGSNFRNEMYRSIWSQHDPKNYVDETKTRILFTYLKE